MPSIQAFRGIRYDLGHVGSLSNVVAPPYDVIDARQQDELYKQHPCNVVRLILNRDEPGDTEGHDRYARAARFLKNWLREGVLFAESDPALYVYHQVFSFGADRFTRRGFMSRVRLERFGEGTIYPHEETHSAAKEDRLRLTKACRANLSQIFGIYPDADNAAQNRLEQEITGVTPLEATDHLGVVHRIWPVTDVKAIADVSALMSGKPAYIADGHHRYETACNYRDGLQAEKGDLPAEHPANFVLMMHVSMDDPGMIVLPTHRLFRGLPPLGSDDLRAKLGDAFQSRVAGEGIDLAPMLWESIASADNQGQMGLYAPVDQRWVLAEVTEKGRAQMAEIAADRSAEWQGLGVSLLHRLLVQTLLGATELPKPTYVHQVDEVMAELAADESKGDFGLAALVMPASLEHIRAISEHGERMPAKSTYFYPKLLSGLVINPLE